MTEPKSYFQTHPTLRNAFRAAVGLSIAAGLVGLFGADTVKVWITDGLAYFGIGGGAE